MSNLAERARTPRPAGTSGEPRTSHLLVRAWLLAVIALFALALPAAADAELFDELLPRARGYEEYFERKPASISFRRSETRAVAAPTRYKTSSILKYSMPLGDTGLIFRVKAKPNPRRLIKLEIRF